jgi:hypothetical protein
VITHHEGAWAARMKPTTRKLIPLLAVLVIAVLAATVKGAAGLSAGAGVGVLVGLALVVIPAGVWFAFGPYVDVTTWEKWQKARQYETEAEARGLWHDEPPDW